MNKVRLYGREFDRRDLLRRVGHLEQISGIESYVLDDGPERGVRALRVRTGTGFCFTVFPDRGMDIGAAEFRGIPVTWSSPAGVVGPWYREPEGEGWLRSFQGGLVATCGLENVGPPTLRGGESLGLHGRISNLPASNVSHCVWWDGSGYVLEVSGDLRDARVFGPNLVLNRKVTARVGESRLRIEDRVENQGWSPAPLMLLYHMNFGWPLLEENTRLIGPGKPGEAPEPRDEEATKGLREWDLFSAPSPGFKERVFYHRPRAGVDGWAEARLENPTLAGGLAASVRFRPEELPEFVQWTMTGEGTYVVGLEPATCRVDGYEAEKAAGRLIHLEAEESRSFQIEFALDAACGLSKEEPGSHSRKPDSQEST